MEKKRIQKEDGRYLVYYHFPESASPEQAEAFAEVDEAQVNGGAPQAAPENASPQAKKG